ncbi:MAG: hypothetical protein ACRDGF_04110, partial [Chloroflexota bacterium]
MDAYRSWRDNEHEDEAAALVGLLAQLRKELLPTRPMQAGSAWHKALEHAVGEEMPGREVRDVLTQDGFTFRILADIDLALPLVAEI